MAIMNPYIQSLARFLSFNNAEIEHIRSLRRPYATASQDKSLAKEHRKASERMMKAFDFHLQIHDGKPGNINTIWPAELWFELVLVDGMLCDLDIGKTPAMCYLPRKAN